MLFGEKGNILLLMKPQDATKFATETGLEELQARMKIMGSGGVGKTPKEVLDKFFDDQGLYFNNRDDDKILAALK